MICESGNRTQPRPGVAPGDPQHEAEGWTSSSGAESMRAAMQRLAQQPTVFVRGSKDPCKMTYSRLAPIERGLLAKMTNQKSE